MAKKAKKRPSRSKRKSTDWDIGQPLAFPPKKTPAVIERLAREAVEEAMSGPLKPKGLKRKKK
jgi:hypothetical protein